MVGFDRYAAVGVAVLLGLFGIMLAESLGLVGGFAVSALTGSRGLVVVASLVVGQVLALSGVYFAFVWLTDRGFNYARVRTPDLGDVVYSGVAVVGMFLALVSVGFVAQNVFGVEPAVHSIQTLVEDNPVLALYLVPVSILVIGPMEELLFRGLIQTYLGEYFDVEVAVVLASLVFAAVHLGPYGVQAESLGHVLVPVSVTFVGGLVFGWLYEVRGNLVAPAAAHGFYNAIQFGLLYVAITWELM
ncbi:MAG: CPBP family intramembrane glutamic endopeptidase [Halobacteriota archaeon]